MWQAVSGAPHVEVEAGADPHGRWIIRMHCRMDAGHPAARCPGPGCAGWYDRVCTQPARTHEWVRHFVTQHLHVQPAYGAR